MRLCDLDEIKVCVDRQYENCHGYSGSKKAIYREAILAVKSILHSAKPIDAVPVVRCQEWISVKDRLPEKDGQYLIFTTQYFTPDHIDEIDHKDGIEISGYCKRYGFLSENGLHAKYWRDIPQPPKGE